MSTKRKLAATVARPVVKPSAKAPSRTRIDEHRTTVSAVAAYSLAPGLQSSPHDPIEISSSSSSEDDQGSDDEKEGDAGGASVAEEHQVAEAVRQNGEKQQLLHSAKKTARRLDDGGADMLSPDEDDGKQPGYDTNTDGNINQNKIPEDELDDPSADPTFGDLTRGTSTIDVTAALAAAAASSNDVPTATTGNTSATLLQGAMPLSIHGTLSQPRSRSATGIVVTTHSLGTVLNQALRTDDAALLESCLQISDAAVVQQTVRRMESGLALQLLTKLAAFMHQKPGRASSLVRWVQCTLVAHGGALAAQPDVAARLEALHGVLAERANGLPSLLKLKGKLDMVVAQIRFRQAARPGFANGLMDRDSGDGPGGRRGSGMVVDVQGDEEISAVVDRPAVVYVEGEEEAEDGAVRWMTKRRPSARAGNMDGDDDDDNDEADGFPAAVNGIIDGDSDEDDEDNEEDAHSDELADHSSVDEDEVDHDDVDDEDDDDEGSGNGEEAGEERSNGGDREEDETQQEAVSAPPAKMRRLESGMAKRR